MGGRGLHLLAVVDANGRSQELPETRGMRRGWLEGQRVGDWGAGALSVPMGPSPPDQEELQMLLFSETLAMVSDKGEPQGELTIEVQRGKHKDEFGVMSHCLLVHAFSRGFMDKMLCGNSLLGRVLAA